MKSSLCLTIFVNEHDREMLYGILYIHNTLGYEEIASTSGLVIKSYFQDMEEAKETEHTIEKKIPYAIVSIDEIHFRDWNQDWNDSITPILLTDKIWVSPRWSIPVLKKEESWIKIEPKMAFGTGRHETTRLAAQALVSINKRENDRSLLDIGTGSGILCFVGNILGFTKSIGIDHDMWCIGSLVENKCSNDARKNTAFAIGSMRSIRENAHFHAIVVNIIRESSEEIVNVCGKHLLKDGKLIWSGLLYDEKDSIEQFLGNNGWSIVEVTRENEWLCYILSR